MRWFGTSFPLSSIWKAVNAVMTLVMDAGTKRLSASRASKVWLLDRSSISAMGMSSADGAA